MPKGFPERRQYRNLEQAIAEIISVTSLRGVIHGTLETCYARMEYARRQAYPDLLSCERYERIARYLTAAENLAEMVEHATVPHRG